MRYLDIDKDFTFLKKNIYWYRAEVSYRYSYTPATFDDPAEEEFDGEVCIYEVTRYEGNYEEKVYDTKNLPTALREAIEEDALEYAMTEVR